MLFNPQVSVGLTERRRTPRRQLISSGRLVWTDARGSVRSALIRTENVSDRGLFVECLSSSEIPLHRLVSISLASRDRRQPALPAALRKPEAQAAVFRVEPLGSNSLTRHYGLRLVEP